MNKMIRRLFLYFFLIACGSAFAVKPKPLVVVLDWFVNSVHAPLFVAQQEEFFKQQGIEVEFISPADVSEGAKMVAVNQADIAVTYQLKVMHKVTNGLPLVRFATLINTPLNCLVVLKDGPIHTIKDLKGKRIGYSAMTTNHTSLAVMLKTAGLSLSDVKLICVKYNLSQALLTGKVDGFIGCWRNFEPVVMELIGKKSVRMFYPEEYGIPMYDELILVANKNKIGDPSLVKFVKALQQGIDYLQKNPQKSWQKFAKNHPELNNAVNEKVWFSTLPYYARNPAKLDKARYRKLAEFMWKEKLISYLPDVESYTVEFGRRRL